MLLLSYSYSHEGLPSFSRSRTVTNSEIAVDSKEGTSRLPFRLLLLLPQILRHSTIQRIHLLSFIYFELIKPPNTGNEEIGVNYYFMGVS